MKRRLEIDLSADMARALEVIDKWHAEQAASQTALAPLHAAKERVAREVMASGAYDARLATEAAHRRMMVSDLALLIVKSAEDAQQSLLALEDSRMRAKAEVRAAQSQSHLEGIVLRFS